jgi:phosphopantetheinyl transferase (holo-ACP synthase)
MRRCALASVEIEAVRRAIEAGDWQWFTARERRELEGRHPRRAAGVLAVKRALCALCRELDLAREPLERDFELSRGEGGAPIVTCAKPLSLEAKSVKNRLFELSVSISHTGDRAHGLAVLDESVRKTGADEG